MNYEFTNDTIQHEGHILYRIRAIKNIPEQHVKEGDLGGYIEKTENLQGNAWVANEAKVYGDARVYGNARVNDYAMVYDYANVHGDASINDRAMVYHHAEVSGGASILGRAKIFGFSKVYGQAKVYDNVKIGVNAQVYGNSYIYDHVRMYGDARLHSAAKTHDHVWIGGEAHIYNDVWVENNAYTYISGEEIKSHNDLYFLHTPQRDITITPNFINIGGCSYPKREWLQTVNEENDEFDTTMLLQLYERYKREWLNVWTPIIISICDIMDKQKETTNE